MVDGSEFVIVKPRKTPAVENKKDKAKTEDKTKTIQELDREKLEKKFSKDNKEKLN